MIREPNALRFRPDLSSQRIEVGRRYVWVVSDPLARTHHYFTDQEYAILQLLDGRRSVRQVAIETARQIAPDFMSWGNLVHFLAMARRNSLLVGPATTVGAEPRVQKPSRQLARRLLAVRLPGIRPGRWLSQFARFTRRFANVVAVVAMICLAMGAMAILVVNPASFAADVRLGFERHGYAWVLSLLLILAGVKVIHELAHAIACRAMGPDCREIGVVLLFGFPCLYCDVSAAWMIPQRWRRILVSAAGMMAEICIAVIAIWIWWFSHDPVVRELLASLVVSCSVTTLVFNANPLMKFDGYFILSDWLGIPNLAAESSDYLRRWTRWFIWSIPMTSVSSPWVRDSTLALYGVASFCYRLFVYMVMAAAIFFGLRSVGLSVVGLVFGPLLLFTLFGQGAWSALRPPTRLERRSRVSRRRYWPRLAVLVVLLGCLVIPLPRGVVAPGIIRARDTVEMVLPESGELVRRLPSDMLVAPGDELFVFRSYELADEELAASARLASLQARLAALEKIRSVRPEASKQMPIVSKAVASAKVELQSILQRNQRLTLRSPVEGRFYFTGFGTPPSFDPESFEKLTTETGTFETDCDSGRYFERGNRVCEIGHPLHRDLDLFVSQQSIALVEVGQAVTVAVITSDGTARVRGKVLAVDAGPSYPTSIGLFARGWLEPDPAHPGQARDVHYQVKVQLEDDVRLPLNSVWKARISVANESLLNRWLQAARANFRLSD